MILGIDPGPRQSAYCEWDGKKIHMRGITLNSGIKDLLGSGHVIEGDTVAIEHLQCFGMPVGKETFETAYQIGYWRRVCEIERLTFLPVYRSEVKMHFCNSMRAKDANIRQALIDRLGKPGTKKNPGITYGVKGDIWSALAIAVMVHDKHLPLQRR